MMIIIIKYETSDEWTIIIEGHKRFLSNYILCIWNLITRNFAIIESLCISFQGHSVALISSYLFTLFIWTTIHWIHAKRLKIRTNAQTWDVLFEIDTLDRQWKYKWAISCCYTFIVHALMLTLVLVDVGGYRCINFVLIPLSTALFSAVQFNVCH